jgi:hypothetical protein
LELFLNFWGSVQKFADRGLILNKYRGLSAKWRGIISFELLSNGISRGLGQWLVDHGRRRPTLDRGRYWPRSSPDLGPAAASGHGGLPRGWQREEDDAV